MRLSRISAFLLIFLVLGGLGTGAAARSAPSTPTQLWHRFHSCGSVGSSAGAGYGSIRAYGLGCRAARRVVRSSLEGELRGWTFIRGTTRDEYRKGRKRITGVPLGDRPAPSGTAQKSDKHADPA